MNDIFFILITPNCNRVQNIIFIFYFIQYTFIKLVLGTYTNHNNMHLSIDDN